MKICHVTSVHQPEDIRIFHKECISLAKSGHDVYLVERGDSYEKNGVHIVGIGNVPKGKIKRITKGAETAYKKALSLDCEVYHIHDPELIPYGIKLKNLGKKVIFDSHEDVPAQIMDKEWIPKILRGIISTIYKKYETRAVNQFDAVVAATPHIAEQFEGRAKKVVVVNNYPKLDDIQYHDKAFTERGPIICYAGGINEIRGEKVMAEAMTDVNGTLVMAGDHEVMTVGGKIQYLGRISREQVNDLYGKAIAGLCILKPIENYYYSQPIKMYEYMAAGIPFICSDFPGWRRVAEESGAGICIDPQNAGELSRAIKFLLSNRDEAQLMGRKGHAYVKQFCNWEMEIGTLAHLYDQ